MVDMEEAYKIYDEYEFNNKTYNKVVDIKCDCKDNIYIPDKDSYYLVCNVCGLCVEQLNKYVLSYSDYSNYRGYNKKRDYKTTTYLRLKINNIFRNKRPVLPTFYIEILKKKSIMNIKIIVKYMKKNKLILKYDPIKSLYKIKSIEPIYINENMIENLIQEFKKKEMKYKENGIKRINYNHTILKIFQELKQVNMFICFDSIQDKKIIEKHDKIYNRIFN